MTLRIMNKLELVKTLRAIAKSQNCKLTLRAASKIADWIKDEPIDSDEEITDKYYIE